MTFFCTGGCPRPDAPGARHDIYARARAPLSPFHRIAIKGPLGSFSHVHLAG